LNGAVTGTVIGGATPGTGNVISGNGVGILLENGLSNIFIEGNKIGTDAAGMGALPNTNGGWGIYSAIGAGVVLRYGVSNVQIGANPADPYAATEGNIIS